MQEAWQCIVLTMCLAELSALTFAQHASAPVGNSAEVVTSTSGESWINHLHRSFSDTSMGKTGRLGPPPAEAGEEQDRGIGLLPYSSKRASLSGADLYRLNCQACHGESGLGAPPEIYSVIDPVRGMSAPLLIQAMKARGMSIGSAEAGKLAKQSQDGLLQRLHKGGKGMPAFPQLNEGEIRALVEHLKHLSGVPGARQLTVMEPPMRVGELVVKSTCHICHDATGPNPTPEQLAAGAIPPLETLTGRTDQSQFIRKVTSGAPIIMGTPPTPYRGRMPVFYYLSSDEAADAYLYLANYPPAEFAPTIPAAAGIGQSNREDTPPSGPAAPPAVTGYEGQASNSNPSHRMPGWVITVWMFGTGAFVLGLLAGGLCFVSYELHRLGREAEHRKNDSSARGRNSTRTPHPGDAVN
jgi:cytochrome c5